MASLTSFQGETGKPILVYGLGRSGKAVCRLLAAQGQAFVVMDERVAKDPEAARDDVALVTALGGTLVGTHLPAAISAGVISPSAISTCIAAPGVPWQHPDLVTLRAGGMETIGEVEWVYRTLIAPAKLAGSDVMFIGITGTAGKTSTTHWTHMLLEHAGKRAFTGGNTGTALADVVLDAGFVANPRALAGVTLVTELSSFQLERCPQLRPDIAVILNLGVDHIDRHGNVRDYHLAKKNLLNNLTAEDTFIYNADDPKLAAWAKETPARALGFSSTQQPVHHVDTMVSPVRVSPVRVSPASRYHAYQQEGRLWLEQHPLLDTSELNVQGSHQHHNALAVALVGQVCGLARDTIKQGLQVFMGVPGRYAQVADIAGVRFVEDSIATRTLAVKAALEATAAPIVWLAGGQDKGAETESLRELVRDKVVLLIGIGEAGSTFTEAFADVTIVRVCEEVDGERALAQACYWGLEALQEVARETPAQRPDTLGTVLLAPLAASFDQFADYHARAQAFRRVVAALARSQLSETEPNETPNKEATWTVS